MADEKAVNDKLNVTTVDKSKRMFLGMKKRMKRPPVVRNQAVQSVGELYFQIAMTGLIVAAVLAIVTVAMGSNKGMFKFRLDRCDCYLTSSSQVHVDAGASCVFDQDHIGVNIGWKSFNIEEAVTTSGCLDGWEGITDIGTPFGDGIYEKKTTTYGNGATGAADACVGLFVVSAFMCIIMYKTVKMSYSGPGSIYSVGLHNIALMCLALSIASGISVAAFWGRVQGKLGTMSNSLAATLFKATLDVCEGAWDDVDAGQFCDASPWTFEVPLFAGWLAIAHVTAMFMTAVWILSKSAFVEGVLDGSIMTDGKTVTPRMVEFENAVGRALATTEDPDYDIQDNQLYTGEQKIMIRPYPLPGTAVKKVMKAAEALVSPLRELSSPKQGVSPSTASQRASESSGSGKFSTPRSGTASGGGWQNVDDQGSSDCSDPGLRGVYKQYMS